MLRPNSIQLKKDHPQPGHGGPLYEVVAKLATHALRQFCDLPEDLRSGKPNGCLSSNVDRGRVRCWDPRRLPARVPGH